MDQELLQTLLDELTATEDVKVVMDAPGAVAEMHLEADAALERHGGAWVKLESGNWHVHLDLGAVAAVQFVDAEDHVHDGIPRLYYVRLADADERTVLRFYFANPWLRDDERPGEFRPERLARFEACRDRYAGREGITFVER